MMHLLKNALLLEIDLVVPHGYPLEQHFVTTRDGYVLRLFRIPHGRASKEAAPRPPRAKAPEEQAVDERSERPVASRKLQEARAASGGAQQGRPVAYLQHGLLDSAAAFVLNGPGISLAFLIADSGTAPSASGLPRCRLARCGQWMPVQASISRAVQPTSLHGYPAARQSTTQPTTNKQPSD
jgi:hypothetical protein